ncbi:MAG: ribonuclease HII [Thermoprotei archaeon]
MGDSSLVGCVGGIDEAGRGALLGPLVIAGVGADDDSIRELAAIGVKDSKQLSPRRREILYDQIRRLAQKVEVLEVNPAEIDSRIKRGVNLNEIELQKMASIAKALECGKVYVDAVDVNEYRWGARLSELVSNVHFISEHSADERYVITGAASVIAKVTRDRRIKELEKVYGPVGSGYPSDPKTRRFVRDFYIHNGALPSCVRTSWKTASQITGKLSLGSL